MQIVLRRANIYSMLSNARPSIRYFSHNVLQTKIMKSGENWHHTSSKGTNLRFKQIALFRALTFPWYQNGEVSSGGLLPLPANGLLSRSCPPKISLLLWKVDTQKSPVSWFIFFPSVTCPSSFIPTRVESCFQSFWLPS